MDYWTLKKKAIMGSMQSGKVAEAEGYPLKLENAIKGNMKDYRIWGNENGLGASGNVDVVTSGKNLFDSIQLLQASGWQYNEEYYYGSVGNLWNKFSYNNRKFNVNIPQGKRIAISFEGRNLAITQPTFSFIIKYTDGTSTTSAYVKDINWSNFSIKSNASKTIDCITCGYQYGDTINLRNIQIAEVDENGEVPDYEPYIEPITTTIDLTGHNSIMPNEYIDYKNGCIVRSDGTEEDIILPKIPLHKGYNIITASDAELEATKMYGKYLKKG